MNEVIQLFSKAPVEGAVLVLIAAIIGWMLHRPKQVATPAKPVEKTGGDRVKNLEAALEKAKAAHKSAKAELDAVHTASVSKAEFDARLKELEAAHQSLASESKRTAALETELRKAQETVRGLNAKINDGQKQQNERSFALENELSKARAELAQMHGRPDDVSELQAEIGRLRESVATSTRFAGELRRRETAALEELDRMRAKLTGPGDNHVAIPEAPTGESPRVAAAKAEVLRLLEENQRRKQASLDLDQQPATED